MASKPAISVVIPTFNRRDLVRQAIASVQAQSFPNWEAIVIDDGSTDHTQETIRPFLHPEKVVYILQANQGRAAARNQGIHAARGEWLLFLDSDDVLLPDALASLYQTASRFPEAGLIAGTLAFIDLNGRPLPALKPKTPLPDGYVGWVYPQMIRKVFFTPGSYLVRKVLLEHTGLFETAMEPCEDYDFCLRAALGCLTAYTATPVAHIRKHEGNTTRARFHRSGIEVARKHFDLLEAESSLNRRQRRRIQSDLMLNIADDYYSLGESRLALRHYLSAIGLCQARAFNYHVVRQALASAVPLGVKKLLKKGKEYPTPV